MSFPVVKIKLPKDLDGVKAGVLPDSLLVSLPMNQGKLHHVAAKAWIALQSAAWAAGIKPFKPTSAGDTYRTLALQKQGFLSRYQREPIEGADTRTWDGVKWYLKKGNAPMAVPGTSNHNLGLAVDVSEASGARLEWMLKHCAEYGFSWEVQSEPWHIRYVCGDKLPDAVNAYFVAKGQPAPTTIA